MDEDHGDVSVIIAAAGEGRRMESGIRKPFLALAGEPVLFRTCRRLAQAPGVLEVIVVAHPEDVSVLNGDLAGQAAAAGIGLVVPGGSCRAETVWKGLEVVSARAELVAVHDAVRPFVSLDTIKALFSTARKRGAAVPVVPLSDTPKRVEGDVILSTPPRTGLMRAQTPQVFQSDLLIEAYEYAMRTGGLSERITDDSQLVEMLGREVAAVLASEFNLKITTPADLRLAEALAAAGMVDL